VTMLPLAHAGLTTPAVAGPGCNEGLGRTGSEWNQGYERSCRKAEDAERNEQ
jgi:hypothetical protein